MTFLGSMFKAESRTLHDDLVKLSAAHLSDLTSEAQLIEWEQHAAQLATVAAHAASEAKTANDEVVNLTSNVARFTAVAEKLAATNEAAAADALNKAEDFQSQLNGAKTNATDATSWANESRQNAENAQQMVMQGKTKLEASKRDQARAIERQHGAEERLAERQRAAGISNGLNSMDAVIDAMSANTKAAQEAAAAANLRSDMLGKASSSDDAIKAALDEVDHGPKPTTLAERIAALKAAK